MPVDGLTCVAQWTVNQYTISFNSNGGSAVSDIKQDYGTSVTAPADPTREGYTFNGWNPAVPSTMPVDGLTCVAQWTVNTYSVKLNTNGGTINAGDVTGYTYGIGATLPTDVTKTGYNFLGWFDNEECSGTAVTEISTTDTGNKEYWAKWTTSDIGNYMDIIDWNGSTLSINMNGYMGSGTTKTNWRLSVLNDNGETRTYLHADAKNNKMVLDVDLTDLGTLNAGDIIYIKVLAADGTTIDSYHAYRVPKIYNTNATLSGINGESIVLVRSGKLTVNNALTVKDIYVYPGAELEINSGLTVTGRLVLRTEGSNDDNALFANSSAVLTNNGTLTCGNVYYSRISRNSLKAFQIGFPYDVNLANVTTSSPSYNARLATAGRTPYGMLFGMLYYDAANRAEEGVEAGNWIGLDPTLEFEMSGNQGYQIIASASTYLEFYFPVAYSKTAPTKELTIAANQGASGNAGDQGWNYIVSPYTQTFTIEPATSPEYNLKITELVLSEGSTGDEVFVQYEPSELKPAAPFYFQAPSAGKLTFGTDATYFTASGGSGAPAYRRVDEIYSVDEVNQPNKLIKPNKLNNQLNQQTQWIKLFYGAENGAEDRTTIYLHNKFSVDYERGFDVAKFTKSGSTPVVYTSLDCGDLAFTALPDSIAATQRIPLTVFAPKADEMYFTIEGNDFMSRLESLLLIDTRDNTTADLLFGDYYYYAEAGTEEGRFFLQPVFRSPKVATDIDNNGDWTNGELISVNGNTITVSGIANGTAVYCYDMTGKLIAAHKKAVGHIEFNVPAAGVYFIHAGETIEKVIVK